MINRERGADPEPGRDPVDRLMEQLLEQYAPPPGKDVEIEDRVHFARVYPGVWDKQMARMARGGLQAIPFGMEDVS